MISFEDGRPYKTLGRAAADGAEPSTLDEPEPLKKVQERRVLVFEDNVDVGIFLIPIPRDLGYETTLGASATRLRLLADANGFDASFSEIVMPGMSGVKRPRNCGSPPNLPFYLRLQPRLG